MNCPPLTARARETLTGNSACIRHYCPSLDQPANDALLFLTWGSAARGLRIQEWVNSSEGWKLYERLIKILRNAPPAGQLVLTLAALVCFVRRLWSSPSETAGPVQGCYLADWDALLKGDDLRNGRAVIERLSFSLLRVLLTIGEDCFGEELSQLVSLLAGAIDKEMPLMHLFDGISDNYWATRMREQRAHDTVFNAMERMCSAAAALKSSSADEKGWTIASQEALVGRSRARSI